MATEDEIQVVAFRVGPQVFAVDILQVERILRYERPTPLPKAPAFLEGVVRYEGGPVPVVDLRKRLEIADSVNEQTRLVVLSLEDERVAVVVDEVLEVMRVDSATITPPPPIVRGLAAPYIAGIIARDTRTIILLQVLRLLTATERLALTGAGG